MDAKRRQKTSSKMLSWSMILKAAQKSRRQVRDKMLWSISINAITATLYLLVQAEGK